MASVERSHWWFRGRRRVIEAMLRSSKLPTNARLLDAGCGSGGNLQLLAKFGTVHAFEYDVDAVSHAKSVGVGVVSVGALPDDVPFSSMRFDAIGMFDVLEHLEDPVTCLKSLRSRLTHDGRLFLTVPAYQWLWGPHDEFHHHYRRYTASSLSGELERAGFTLEYLGYTNALLLPFAIIQRVAERFKQSSSGVEPPPTLLNEILYRCWAIEARLLPQVRLPFGLSVLAVARPDNSK